MQASVNQQTSRHYRSNQLCIADSPRLIASARSGHTRQSPGSAPASNPQQVDPVEFASKLIAAVKEQMGDLTYYNARYIPLSYPMGDVPANYGVCSDVLVRAYRRLGFDLQELVYRARIGKGDISIDHRRTEVLREFFARHGEVLPITDFPEDYKPGDIVSYYRPYGRSSKSHIAIIADEIAPTGRPYLLHNRAWGVHREDALFVDKITGHYRFNKVKPYRTKVASRGSSAGGVNAAGVNVGGVNAGGVNVGGVNVGGVNVGETDALPQRAPPRNAVSRVAKRAKRRGNSGRRRLVAYAKTSPPTAIPALPSRRSRDRNGTRDRNGPGRKRSLCSRSQPRAIRVQIAHLCSPSARAMMGLGGPQ